MSNIFKIPKYSWAEKSRFFFKKIKKENIKRYKDIIEFYWLNRGNRQFNLDFNSILRLRL